ncbi:MAG: gfo/Idh/MocA family oxidoreductase [Chloroflexi bacterium]|nr:MAG: gfo/Idh/MocA family oxidoreductase [Chloroflexota bacterium]HDN79257.1 Gfo/Idh/MocA family oxidoreductase [Chloroflexota bacterium]
MKEINLGIVSFAHPHAPRYAAAIVNHPYINLIGIAGLGVNASLAQQTASRYGVPYYDDFAELLEKDELAGIYVGTEPRRHLEVVREAATRGKHILCDKPIALTLEEADEIIRICREAGVKLMVPFNPRFQLPVMKVKEALDSGEAGELISIFAIKYGKLPTKIPLQADYSWLIDPEEAGGGGFLDIGIHAVDALRWLAGSEARRVYAHIGTVIHKGLALDDIGTLTVEFANGVVGTLSAGWANPDGYPTWLDVRFEILTTKAAFLIDSPYHAYWYYDSKGAKRLYWWRRDVDGLVDEFAKAISEDREPAITGEDARAALAITLAAYESARTGKVVTL